MLLHKHRATPVDGWLTAYEQDVVRTLETGRTARLVAGLRGHALDHALAEGADPAATRQLAARAARLTAQASRDGVADGLERLVGTLDAGRSRWRVPPSRAAVRENAAELRALAARLRGPAPVYARGVALLRELLTNGTGAAYTDPDGRTLADELRTARIAVGG